MLQIISKCLFLDGMLFSQLTILLPEYTQWFHMSMTETQKKPFLYLVKHQCRSSSLTVILANRAIAHDN